MNDRVIWPASMGALTRFEAHGWRVHATQEVSYEVRQIDGIFGLDSLELIACGRAQPCLRQAIVIDARVDQLYGEEMRAYYGHHGVEVSILSLSVSEETKDLDAAMTIARHLESAGVLRRSEPVVAIGGGVLLDLVGFAAGLYRRGIPYVKVPTNAMALWDAAVGIKTAVNALDRRNRLGSYHAPTVALLDRSFLSTVESRELSNGMGELLKLAVIKSPRLFDLLERHSEMLLLTRFQDGIVAPEVIGLAVEGMLEELAPNLWELTLDRCVDFGHSFAPLVEMKALPELLHGEAVALDVLFSCRLARARGLLADQDVRRVVRVMKSMQLPLRHRFFEQPGLLQEALADTMRHRDGRQRLPLPDGIGACRFVNDVDANAIRIAAEEMAHADA
ncbi:iron-containing alcohol dehydrogenase [Acidovorax sp. SUPP1855]|uniref:sedoheptulose 7-phosphate cyclase n=1 Tax=Acidovorax sp. SUPP1855 TaxID=431774 RepID=UPI0023DE3476|nr:sedoheptulose 7-phosphate cyclase [Acidovorax sp. SUPP1855]GKS84315.1 iron-containing alcohol dehydrogenase [Acidovorax sp. SUPP1855]